MTLRAEKCMSVCCSVVQCVAVRAAVCAAVCVAVRPSLSRDVAALQNLA